MTNPEKIRKDFYKKFTNNKKGDFVSSEDGDLYEGAEIFDYFIDLITSRDQDLVEKIRGMKCRCMCDANKRLDRVINLITQEK